MQDTRSDLIIRGLITWILQNGKITTVNENDSNKTDETFHEGNITVSQHHKIIFDDLLNFFEFKSNDLHEVKVDRNNFLDKQLKMLLPLDFVEFKRVDTFPTNPKPKTPRIIYSLTGKGFDAALKFQEHEDNEKRFNNQIAINEVLKENSTKSLRTAKVALLLSSVLIFLGIYRVHQLEQKITSHQSIESRLELLESQIKSKGN